MTVHLVLSLAVLTGGLVTIAAAVVERRRGQALAVALADDAPVSFPLAADVDVWEERLDEPVTTRVLGPAAERLVEAVRRTLPSSHLAAVRRRIVLAGLAGRLRAEEYVTLQLLAASVGILLALLVARGDARSFALGALVIVIALALPRALLDGRRSRRVEAVRRELPDTIDLLAVCVEAGQAFEAALRTVAGRGSGLLAAEFRHVLREMELGVPRRLALEHLRDRLDVPDLSGFVAALIQADTLGTSIGDVLHLQATEQRRRRRQQVREQAGKLPVKMLIPLTFLILPALFVVILGPAGLTIARMFAG